MLLRGPVLLVVFRTFRSLGCMILLYPELITCRDVLRGVVLLEGGSCFFLPTVQGRRSSWCCCCEGERDTYNSLKKLVVLRSLIFCPPRYIQCIHRSVCRSRRFVRVCYNRTVLRILLVYLRGLRFYNADSCYPVFLGSVLGHTRSTLV